MLHGRQTAPSLRSSAKPRVLVVDDEPFTREILEMALTGWGYSVFLARDGEEAIEIINRNKPPLVIADVVLPQMNGINLLRAVKKMCPETAVILITAYGSLNDAITSIREGAADFLTKPLDYVRLKRLVKELCCQSAA